MTHIDDNKTIQASVHHGVRVSLHRWVFVELQCNHVGGRRCCGVRGCAGVLCVLITCQSCPGVLHVAAASRNIKCWHFFLSLLGLQSSFLRCKHIFPRAFASLYKLFRCFSGGVLQILVNLQKITKILDLLKIPVLQY